MELLGENKNVAKKSSTRRQNSPVPASSGGLTGNLSMNSGEPFAPGRGSHGGLVRCRTRNSGCDNVGNGRSFARNEGEGDGAIRGFKLRCEARLAMVVVELVDGDAVLGPRW